MVIILNKIKLLILISFFFLSKSIFTSQIVDFETERLVDELIEYVKKANYLNKKINYKIYIDNRTNAFVSADNKMYLSSSLIENSPDYTSLLGVIAHEIGHIDLNHINQRKKSINNIKKLQNLGTLSIVGGSLISDSPEMLQSLIVGSGTLNNTFLNFSKDQEREADYYSINTLKTLNKSFSSVIKLLKIIEEEAKSYGFTEERQKYGTHPLFSERIDILDFEESNTEKNFDNDLNNRFLFVKSKFIGFNNKPNKCRKLKDEFKLYCESIIDAKNGNLSLSLKKINDLINKDYTNIYLIETKADILMSYGYTNEAIRFYEKIINNLPENKYVQLRIISNLDISLLTEEKRISVFKENLNILYKYYNNRNILLKYLELSKILNKNEWIEFLEIWINSQNYNSKELENKINYFINSNDKDLNKLIYIIKQNY